MKFKLKPFAILTQIDNSKGLKAKFNLLIKYKDKLQEIIDLTYNPSKNYYIRVKEETDFKGKRKNTFEEFKALLHSLNSREITGNNAKTQVEQFLSSVIYNDELWYRKIINRDLKVGLGNVTIKSVYPELFPDINVQSPKDFKTYNQLPEKFFLEPKIDGIRCLTIIEGFEIKCFSRNGKRLNYIETMIQKENIPKINCVLDGELFFQSWNKSMSIISSGNDISKLKYYVFDFLLLSDYQSKRSDKLFQRKISLERYFSKFHPKQLVNNEFIISDDKSKINYYYEHYLSKGFEGLMIKDYNSEYKFKRSNDWLRLKKREMETYICVGVNEGTGKDKGRLGSLSIQINNNIVKVGSGFTSEMRNKLWKEPPIGKMIEVYIYKSEQREAKAITPIFARVREDI